MSLVIKRVLTISDLHIDVPENKQWVDNLSKEEYQDDVLIVAGDVTDHLDRLSWCFESLTSKFNAVFFVPGNHELWVKSHEKGDSFNKFQDILKLCQHYDVMTSPKQILSKNLQHSLWIVPVFSWYQQPEEGDQGLFINQNHADDKTSLMWRDNLLVKWPSSMKKPMPDVFLDLSSEQISRALNGPLLTFSHFLPNKAVMFPTDSEKKWRLSLGQTNPHPEFNFSRVAGYSPIDKWIRQYGSLVHIYGHQHRNRQVLIDDVTYVSHCLGYPREREAQLLGPDPVKAPLVVWQDGVFTV